MAPSSGRLDRAVIGCEQRCLRQARPISNSELVIARDGSQRSAAAAPSLMESRDGAPKHNSGSCASALADRANPHPPECRGLRASRFATSPLVINQTGDGCGKDACASARERTASIAVSPHRKQWARCIEIDSPIDAHERIVRAICELSRFHRRGPCSPSRLEVVCEPCSPMSSTDPVVGAPTSRSSALSGARQLVV
eukprot:1927726-Prymnesium_polylepis.1